MKRQAFLVYDENLKNLETCEVYSWLKEEAFAVDTNNPKAGYPYWGCAWVYID